MPIERPVLLVNAGSRAGQENLAQAALHLENCGLKLARAEAIEPDLFDDVIREEAANGSQVIFIGGGDGSQRIAAAALKDTNTALGVIPLGTGNALARDLGIPVDLAKACETLVNGVIDTIDIGEANGEIFVNIASLGITVDVAEKLDTGLKKIIGRFAYLGPLASALEQATPFRALFQINGEITSFETLVVVAGCGKTQGGVLPLPGPAGHQTGKLIAYALRGRDPLLLADMVFRLSGNSENYDDLLMTFEAEEMTIMAEPSQKAVIDGEPRLETPLKLKCLPRALKVLLPVSELEDEAQNKIDPQ